MWCWWSLEHSWPTFASGSLLVSHFKLFKLFVSHFKTFQHINVKSYISCTAFFLIYILNIQHKTSRSLLSLQPSSRKRCKFTITIFPNVWGHSCCTVDSCYMSLLIVLINLKLMRHCCCCWQRRDLCLWPRDTQRTERALLPINKTIFGCNEGIGSPIREPSHPNFGRGRRGKLCCFKPSAGGRRSIEPAGISARALIVTRFIVLWLMDGLLTFGLQRTWTHWRQWDHQESLSGSRNVQNTKESLTFSQRHCWRPDSGIKGDEETQKKQSWDEKEIGHV